jgi:hypothetical protein
MLKLKPQELEKLDIVGVMESLEVVDGILRFLINLITPQVNRDGIFTVGVIFILRICAVLYI